MQETRNNCFGSKRRSTTFHQAKTVKHECQNVATTLCALKYDSHLFAELIFILFVKDQYLRYFYFQAYLSRSS